jgi:Methyltransferase domain
MLPVGAGMCGIPRMRRGNNGSSRMTIAVRDIELRLWDTSGTAPAPSNDRVILLLKKKSVLDRLHRVVRSIVPKFMIELGIYDGGSTIHWQDRFQLQRLVAFDINPDAPHLTRYLERHGLGNTVRTHFGVSQDDGVALRAALGQNVDMPFVDLIVDDASHQYAETRAAVEILLPYLRTGGAYIIEDWAWGHHSAWPPEAWSDRPLMSPLLSELMLICGSGRGVIDRIEIDPNFAVLWRGDHDLRKDGGFKLAEHYTSRGFSAAF